MGENGAREAAIVHNHVRVESESSMWTIYAFRGPKSHRKVRLMVKSVDCGRYLEEVALKKANAKYLKEWITEAVKFGRDKGE